MDIYTQNRNMKINIESIILEYYELNRDHIRWKKNLSSILKESYFLEYEEYKKVKLNFLNDPSDYQVMWHVINNNYEKHVCINCKTPTKFNRQFFYHSVCSRKCSADVSAIKNIDNREKIVERAKKTSLERYGVDSVSKLESTKEKKKKTCLERYGVDNPLKRKDIQEKQFKKMQETNMKRYGVKSTLSHKETWEKYTKTMMERYNVDSPWKNKTIRDKAENTTKERYGAKNYTQSKDWMEKFKNHEWGNKYYEYVMPSGKIIKIQGYENYAIKELLKNYGEDDLELVNKPLIKYNFKNKLHLYKCDIFIPNEKRIIEVKSTFTYNLQKDKNEEKASACIDLGYKFEFWIINRKGEIKIINR